VPVTRSHERRGLVVVRLRTCATKGETEDLTDFAKMTVIGVQEEADFAAGVQKDFMKMTDTRSEKGEHS